MIVSSRFRKTPTPGPQRPTKVTFARQKLLGETGPSFIRLLRDSDRPNRWRSRPSRRHPTTTSSARTGHFCLIAPAA